MRTKGLAALLLALCLCAVPALGEDALPEDLRVLETEALGDWRLARLEADTGERLALLEDAEGAPLWLVTTEPAEAPDAGPQDTDIAEVVAQEACPGGWALASELETESVAIVHVVSERFFGWVRVSGDQVLQRRLEGGHFLRSDGCLTLDGALRALAILRPGLQVLAVEYEDDRVYEGAARLDGAYYEYELDAATGRLLEWEGD